MLHRHHFFVAGTLQAIWLPTQMNGSLILLCQQRGRPSQTGVGKMLQQLGYYPNVEIKWLNIMKTEFALIEFCEYRQLVF